WVTGVFVHRGRVLPAIDLNRLAGAGDCPDHLGSRIILVSHPAGGPDALVGLLAAMVAEVRELPDPPEGADALTGSPLGPAVADGAGVVRVFDPDRFFGRSEFAPGATRG